MERKRVRNRTDAKSQLTLQSRFLAQRLALLRGNGFLQQALLLRLSLEGVQLSKALTFRLRDLGEDQLRDLLGPLRRVFGSPFDRITGGRHRLALLALHYTWSMDRFRGQTDESEIYAFPSRKGGPIAARTAERNLERALGALTLRYKEKAPLKVTFRSAFAIGLRLAGRRKDGLERKCNFELPWRLICQIRWFFEKTIWDVHERDDAMNEAFVRLLQMSRHSPRDLTVHDAIYAARSVRREFKQERSRFAGVLFNDWRLFADNSECKELDQDETEVDHAVRIAEIRTAIDDLLKRLTYREREVIRLRWGLGDGYSYTASDVGRIFKVTPQRVWQLEMRALKKLTRYESLMRFRREYQNSSKPVSVSES
jgi:RNA polymerase sigma factor (sigma-70 family)